MNVPVPLQRLWIQITADRKRFGLFCTMLGVGLLLWARLIVITNTPRTVVADEKVQASVTSPVSTAPSVVLPSKSKPIQVKLATTPARDPFVISPEHYPHAEVISENPKDQGKSDLQQAEDSEQARALRIAASAGKLRLEGVLSSPTADGTRESLAMINTRTYRLNDEIPAPGEGFQFQLVHIGERSVTIEYDGYRFERTILVPGQKLRD